LGALSKIMQLQNRVALVTGASRGGKRLAAPAMVEAGRGLIVNITWILDRPHGHAFYEVVKNATNELVRETPATPSSRRPRA